MCPNFRHENTSDCPKLNGKRRRGEMTGNLIKFNLPYSSLSFFDAKIAKLILIAICEIENIFSRVDDVEGVCFLELSVVEVGDKDQHLAGDGHRR
jgi:hypothetical protein